MADSDSPFVVPTATSNPAGSPKLSNFATGLAAKAEFERFEDLASKLLQVSKEELDEKRQTT